jgi:hypothetical protein
MAATVLRIKDTRFSLNGRPTFLLGISYYGALGSSEAALKQDLDEMQRHGFNWLRLWATWYAFEHDVSAVDGEGNPRPQYLERLKSLVADCDRRGMVVDVTFSRGNGVTGPQRLQSLAAHRRAVETVIGALRPHRNWYLDLSNERNIRDARHTSDEDLKVLRDVVRKLDPERLVTASHAGDIDDGDLRDYLQQVRVDFISPHRPRDVESPGQTAAKSREYLAAMKALGRVVPLHCQEPFRRGFGGWEPTADDFLTDLRSAIAGGAAGWCFHNGDERDQKDGRPRRSCDLREGRLFDQLDAEEMKVVAGVRRVLETGLKASG